VTRNIKLSRHDLLFHMTIDMRKHKGKIPLINHTGYKRIVLIFGIAWQPLSTIH